MGALAHVEVSDISLVCGAQQGVSVPAPYSTAAALAQGLPLAVTCTKVVFVDMLVRV